MFCLIFSIFYLGMPVIVHQTEVFNHSKWCRGEITKIFKGEGIVEVFLVDYGDTLSVSWSNLRRIQTQFASSECQVGNELFFSS